nr:hypothetical protein [Limnohabitans sp. DM1]
MHSEPISSTCSVLRARRETSDTTTTSPCPARSINLPSGRARQSVLPLAVSSMNTGSSSRLSTQ